MATKTTAKKETKAKGKVAPKEKSQVTTTKKSDAQVRLNKTAEKFRNLLQVHGEKVKKLYKEKKSGKVIIQYLEKEGVKSAKGTAWMLLNLLKLKSTKNAQKRIRKLGLRTSDFTI